LPEAPVAHKRPRFQPQPLDIGRLVVEIDGMHAAKAKAAAQSVRAPRLASPSGGGGKARAEGGVGGQVQAGGGADARAAFDRRYAATWLKVVQGDDEAEPKPVFLGRCGKRTAHDVSMMQPLTELPECQPQAEYIPAANHDSDPFVGEHVNLHRPYKDRPVQLKWEVVSRDA